MNRSFTFVRVVAVLLWALSSSRAGAQTWQRLATTPMRAEPAGQGNFTAYQTDQAALLDRLRKVPPEGTSRPAAEASIVIPSPEGRLTEFFLEETQILQPGANMPAVPVHTYSGYSRDKSELIHLSTCKDKVYGIVLKGNYTWYISTPNNKISKEELEIQVFDDAGRPYSEPPASCGQDDAEAQLPGLPEQTTLMKPTLTPSTNCFLRTYRLALACTGEFTVASGSQADAIANLTALINTVNAVYERDLGVRFTIVTNNNLIYTDPATDPFDPAAGSCGQLTVAGTTIGNNLSSADYDVGISIFYTNFGGCAAGSICGGGKAKTTAGYNSLNPTSYLRTVTAHELGHQLGAGHSHNSNASGCNIALNSAWEVGGGSTIMSYASCSPSYPSYNTSVYFHAGNTKQMMNRITSVAGSCYTAGPANTTPLITTPSDDTFFIPVSTPYRLYADAIDAEDNNLLYSFEQTDLGTGDSTLPTPATTIGPIVRNFQPSANAYRYIPRMDSLRANIYPRLEVLPSVPRLLTFWATVRDNHPGCGCSSVDTFLIRTTGTVPFQVTSLNTATTLNSGDLLTLTWDVATTNLTPVNTQTVQVLFAADGLNYNTVLLASTPNNGTATVAVPNVSTSTGRIMVAARDNIFFDINNADITILPTCATAQESGIWPENPVQAAQGDPTLQLDLKALFGPSFDTMAGEITATDPTGIIGFRNSPTDTICRAGSGYSGRYDLFRFRIGQPGTYTIGRTLYTLSPSLYMTLYGAGGLVAANAANACTNWYTSTAYFSSPTSSSLNTNASLTFTAARDSVYTIAVLRRGTTNLGTYSINIYGPARVYPESQIAAGNYAYLVVDNSGTIIAISPSAPNLQSQAPGNYIVYGVSYSPSLSINSYLNQPFNNLLNASFSANECAVISRNRIAVNITPNTPLSNDYLQLTARKERNAARLDWQTEATAGIAGFQLEQSSDGRIFSPFIALNKDQAGMNEGHYSYLHTGIVSGNNYYRIKANRTDGSSRYSNIAVVSFADLPGLTVIPNPATSEVKIQVKGYPLPLTAVLSDMSGKVLRQLTISQDNHAFSVADLAPGMYLISGKGFAIKLTKR